MAICTAHNAAPHLSITVAVKGLLGKCGCTRMVQGGYIVALAREDSVELYDLMWEKVGVIRDAAAARTDSRGAHLRSDYPQAESPKQSAFASIQNDRLSTKPVAFPRVRPGQSLLKDAA